MFLFDEGRLAMDSGEVLVERCCATSSASAAPRSPPNFFSLFTPPFHSPCLKGPSCPEQGQTKPQQADRSIPPLASDFFFSFSPLHYSNTFLHFYSLCLLISYFSFPATFPITMSGADTYPPLDERPLKDTIVLFDVDETLTPARLVS